MNSLDKIEKYIDNLYVNQPFWSIPDKFKVYSLLSAYDSFYIVRIELANKTKDCGVNQNFKFLEQGFIQAMQWTTQTNGISISQTNNEQHIIDAGQFILFCAEYCKVSACFILSHRNIFKYTIQENSVCFSKKQAQNTQYSGYAERFESITQKNDKSTPPSDNNPLALKISYELRNGMIYFLNAKDIINKDVTNTFGNITDHSEFEIDDNEDFSGFTNRDLKKFWVILKTWSELALNIYKNLAYTGTPQEDCLPTQILPLNTFVTKMRNASHLPKSTISLIINRFNALEYKKKDPVMAPFIILNGLIAWSTLAVTQSSYERNMLKNMCRRSDLKKTADNIIGKSERFLITKTIKLLNTSGTYHISSNKKFKTKYHEGEIDILLYTPTTPHEILLIECKSFLPTDEINELYSSTKEMIHAQQQLRSAWNAICKMTYTQKLNISQDVNWDKINNVYMIVITPDSQPTEQYDGSEIPHITVESIRCFFSHHDTVSPAKIWKATKEKKWLEKYKNGTEYHETTVLGHMSFAIPYTACE